MSVPDKDRRTHAPTPKRVRDFRKRGEIAMSRDVIATATLLGGGIACIAFSGMMYDSITELMRRSMVAPDTHDPGLPGAATMSFITVCLPAAVGAIIGCLIAGMLQIGWPPAFRWPKFNLAKPFSFGSIKNILSPPAMGRRALNATAKVAVVAFAGVLIAHSDYRSFLTEPALDAETVTHRIGGSVASLVTGAGAALAGLAVIDYVWQRHQLMAKMKMTTEEVKREHKEQEGDPAVRRERKRRQRALAERRLVEQVKTADVVLVNPTHYSVALRYRADSDSAPQVVAKGRDEIAAKIREVARHAGIPVVSRPPLTRLLYKLVPEGREIPAEVYTAVAEVLAFVYRVRNRHAGNRGAGAR